MFARIVFPTLGIYALTKVVPTWLMIGACLFTIIVAILVLDAVEKESWTMVALFPIGVVLVTVAHFFPSYPVNTLGLVAVAGSGIMKLKHKEEPVSQQVAAPPVVALPVAPPAAAPRPTAQGTARPQSPANPRPVPKMPPAGPKKSLNRYD